MNLSMAMRGRNLPMGFRKATPVKERLICSRKILFSQELGLRNQYSGSMRQLSVIKRFCQRQTLPVFVIVCGQISYLEKYTLFLVKI